MMTVDETRDFQRLLRGSSKPPVEGTALTADEKPATFSIPHLPLQVRHGAAGCDHRAYRWVVFSSCFKGGRHGNPGVEARQRPCAG